MARRRRKPRQQSFAFATRRRHPGGRPPRPENVGLQPHCARPKFVARVPAHVTMRAMRGAPSMRAEVVARIVVAEIARASEDGFRVLHYSVQDDHLHLIAEGDDGTRFSRGMQRLASRIAMRINALARRRGRLWRERYHRRDLATPRQFRNALVYVTFNIRKHAPPRERALWAKAFDPLSSMFWLDDWTVEAVRDAARAHRARAGPRPTALPKTWIARVGWKSHGAIAPDEAPKTPA